MIPLHNATNSPAIRNGLINRAVLLGIGLCFALPFLQPYHSAPLPSFEAEWLAAVLLSATLLMVALSAHGKATLQWPLPAFVCGLLAVAALQAATGRLTYSYALSNLGIVSVAVLGAYSLGRWIVERGLLDAALAAASVATIAGGLVSVVLQCLQLLEVQGLPEWLVAQHSQEFTSQPYANVGQPNHLATYLALGLVATIYLDSRRWPRLAVRLAQVALAAGIALTASRMGLLMVLLIALTPLSRRRITAFGHGELGWGLSGSLVFGFIAGAMGASLAARSMIGSVSTVERVTEAAYGDRLTMWADAVRITLSSPFTGVGAGEYAHAQYWLAKASPQLIGTPYAHNTVLQFAAEFGVIAGLAFATFCLWWLLSDWRRRCATPALMAAWAMVALIGVHAMLEWSLWVLFVAVLGAFLVALAEPPLRRRFAIDVRAIFAVLGIGALAWAPLMWADYSDAATASRKLEFEQSVGFGVSKDLVDDLVENSDKTFFKPQYDRFVVRAAPPVRRPVTDAQVERTWKTLTRLPEDRTIAVYVSALALTGRSAEGVPHVARMRVFAVSPERYRAAAKIVTDALDREDVAAPALRAELARWEGSLDPAPTDLTAK